MVTFDKKQSLIFQIVFIFLGGEFKQLMLFQHKINMNEHLMTQSVFQTQKDVSKKLVNKMTKLFNVC